MTFIESTADYLERSKTFSTFFEDESIVRILRRGSLN
jgi:hypothetical protein